MCTLALVRNRLPRYPLIVAANRDESLRRPSTPPRLWPGATPFVGGRDELAGGTWLGVNVHGLVVGLTNHWNGQQPDPQRASRGRIVSELLEESGLEGVRRALARRDPQATNPFLLVAAQRDGEAFWVSSAEGLVVHPIDQPVFAIANQTPEEDRSARAHRLGDRVEDALTQGEDDPAALARALAARLAHHDGDRGPLESVCVHTGRDFGTVSSTILLLGEDPADDRLHHADGAPCTHDFADLTALLTRLHEA